MIKVKLQLAMAHAGLRRQKELAEKTGLTESHISKISQEKSGGISYKTLDRLCEALGCGVGDILEHVPNE